MDASLITLIAVAGQCPAPGLQVSHQARQVGPECKVEVEDLFVDNILLQNGVEQRVGSRAGRHEDELQPILAGVIFLHVVQEGADENFGFLSKKTAGIFHRSED